MKWNPYCRDFEGKSRDRRGPALHGDIKKGVLNPEKVEGSPLCREISKRRRSLRAMRVPFYLLKTQNPFPDVFLQREPLFGFSLQREFPLILSNLRIPFRNLGVPSTFSSPTTASSKCPYPAGSFRSSQGGFLFFEVSLPSSDGINCR
ncbi:hypothetical protein Y032_0260g528 [Ancylostoma ceylanicum]|uniref:Uncharacterized protein n=1 Tax=Ancylostoma ceylanicum TaxID=53326 RepID=A0A016SB75_9BILA|nr:hypothetical protein Y032_0260g528 [Ancylostoma ceylanicum]